MKDKIFRILFILAIIIVAFFVFVSCTLAYTKETTMSADFNWNNCNIYTTKMPAPRDIEEYPISFGEIVRINIVAKIGDSFFFAIWENENVERFYLGEATWSIDNGNYIDPVCNL